MLTTEGAARMKKATNYTLLVSGIPTPMTAVNPVGSVVVSTGLSSAGSSARSHA